MKEIKPKIDPIITLVKACSRFKIPRSTIVYYLRKKYINTYKIPTYEIGISVEELKEFRRKKANKYKI